MREIRIFDPDTDECVDVSGDFDGEWTPYEGKTSDGRPVQVQRIDEDFVWVGKSRNLAYKAGDYVAVSENADGLILMWPVEAGELANSDGRETVRNRYLYG